METRRSKTEQVCDEVRLGLQLGRYVAGGRIDPDALATTFRTSLTPVRYALHRLAAEGVLEDHGRSGFRVPLPTEFELRDHYDWAEWLLSLASSLSRSNTRRHTERLEFKKRSGDVVALTRQLFDAIALAAGRPSLYSAVRLVNDKLGAIRRIERHLIHDAFEELSALHQLWLKRNVAGAKRALFEYHERRRKMVSQIVAASSCPHPHGRLALDAHLSTTNY